MTRLEAPCGLFARIDLNVQVTVGFEKIQIRAEQSGREHVPRTTLASGVC